MTEHARELADETTLSIRIVLVALGLAGGLHLYWHWSGWRDVAVLACCAYIIYQGMTL